MKTNKIKVAVLTALLSLSMIVVASAQQNNNRKQKPPTFKELLEKMDNDEDGKLSLKEIEGPLKDDFDKIDENEDGYITEEEFDNAPKPERKKK